MITSIAFGQYVFESGEQFVCIVVLWVRIQSYLKDCSNIGIWTESILFNLPGKVDPMRATKSKWARLFYIAHLLGPQLCSRLDCFVDNSLRKVKSRSVSLRGIHHLPHHSVTYPNRYSASRSHTKFLPGKINQIIWFILKYHFSRAIKRMIIL